MIGFYRAYDSYGEFSNWYMYDMVIDGITFCSSEQYLMWGKAMLFHDTKTAAKILDAKSNAQMKRLGRLVSGFNDAIWNDNREEIMCAALREKFKAGTSLGDFLQSTGDELLAECSPTDTIWGIGLARDDSRVFDQRQWRGKNLLGKCLMQVREELRNEL